MFNAEQLYAPRGLYPVDAERRQRHADHNHRNHDGRFAAVEQIKGRPGVEHQQQAKAAIGDAAAEAIREPARQRDHRKAQHRGDKDRRGRHGFIDHQHLRHIADHKALRQIRRAVFADTQADQRPESARARPESACVRRRLCVARRGAFRFQLLLSALEHRGFAQMATDPERRQGDQHAAEERNAPSPGQQALLIHLHHRQPHQRGEQRAAVGA